MNLTPCQEEQLIQQYDRLLWSIVHRFKRRSYNGYENKEDLHSECVLVFIRHIRSCDTMDDVQKVPIRDMINAMCRFVLGEQTLTYPQRTTDFSHVMKKVAHKTDYSAVDRDSSQRYEPMNDALDEVAFRDYLSSLSEEEKQMIQMKLEGKRNRELAQAFGVTDVIVTRTLKRLRNSYPFEAA